MYGGRSYAKYANDEMACIAMIETAEALENLDDICSTPGLDAIYIGPSDLAYAIGLHAVGDNSDPRHVATVNHVYATARRHGIHVGMHTGSLEYTKRYLEQGFRHGNAGSRHIVYEPYGLPWNYRRLVTILEPTE